VAGVRWQRGQVAIARAATATSSRATTRKPTTARSIKMTQRQRQQATKDNEQDKKKTLLRRSAKGQTKRRKVLSNCWFPSKRYSYCAPRLRRMSVCEKMLSRKRIFFEGDRVVAQLGVPIRGQETPNPKAPNSCTCIEDLWIRCPFPRVSQLRAASRPTAAAAFRTDALPCVKRAFEVDQPCGQVAQLSGGIQASEDQGTRAPSMTKNRLCDKWYKTHDLQP
jgi:hypothetical protein